MKRIVVLSSIVLFACVALVASATAAVQPVSPAPGAKVKNKRPTFSWAIPAGEVPTVLAISKKAAMDDDGFVDNEIFDLLDDTDTSHKIDRSLPAGKYFWAVKSQIPSPFETFWTAPQQFKILPKAKIRKPKISRFVAIDQASITVAWVGNLKPATVKIRILHGKRKLFSDKEKIAFASVDRLNRAFFRWRVRGKVAQGTTVKLEMTVSGAGKSFKRVASFKAP